MKWTGSLFELLFGCWHSHLSFPVTLKRPAQQTTATARQTGTYVVCLDCGREFPYDWEHMQIASEVEPVHGKEVLERAA